MFSYANLLENGNGNRNGKKEITKTEEEIKIQN